MQDLFISIDPGFDTMKVVANGHTFKFPFNVVETDERKMNDYNLQDDFLLYKDEHGITSRVGQYARELIFERKTDIAEGNQMETFYTEGRFTSGSFIVGIRTAIALAIRQEGFPSNFNGNIYLMIALPHACRDRFAPTVIGSAAGSHQFYLRAGTERERRYSFHIAEQNIFTVSQTIAAILGETSDDFGRIDREKFFYLSNGPTLVLDGGYYTMGVVELSKSGSVDDNKTESDTTHAMRNVNMAVAEKVQAVRPDVQHYVIEYLLKQNDGKLRYMADGKVAMLDLNLLRSEAMTNVCSDFIAHLNQKYNNLLDINYVLITGGTGANFYEQIKDYYVGAGILDSDHLLLSSSKLGGELHPIEFAITIGAYKGLRGKLRK